MSTQNVIDEIALERHRQQTGEGRTREHDDEHNCSELARAAACYADFASRDEEERSEMLDVPCDWPWRDSDWKPKTPRRDLIRAAALIVAEIERLDRLASSPSRDGAGR